MSGRPEILYPLFSSVETLEGIGPKTAQNLSSLHIETPRDLLFTLPHTGIDRQLRDTVEGVELPRVLTVTVTIGTHVPARTKGGAYRINVRDAKTAFQIVFFHARGDYWQRALPEGSRRVVSGKVEIFDGLIQMVHPDHTVPEDRAAEIPRFEPVYPLTAGVTQKVMQKAARAALQRVPELPEWIDPAQVSKMSWPTFQEAVELAHTPTDMSDLSATSPARVRLAYDEFMAHQLTLALARARERKTKGRKTVGDGHLQARVLKALPYQPTTAQKRAVEEINSDLGAIERDESSASGGCRLGENACGVSGFCCVRSKPEGRVF